MELGYDLLVSAFTALCFSFLVARLLSFALSGDENSGGNGEGKKLRVKVSKSRKKRIKKTSSSQEMSPIEDQDDQKRVLESVGEAVGVGNGDGVTSDGEEWEGIDRNELERDFAKAVSFVEKGGLDELGSGVMVQFYGLQKAAMGGDCGDEAKLAARTMWNAWPKFGSMNPEEAMEKYIALLSEKVPGWMEGHSPLEGKMKSEEDEACGSSETNSTCTYESKPGVEPATWTGDLAGQSSSVNKDEQ